MYLKKAIQGAVLFLGFASLNMAMAESLMEREGTSDDDNDSAQGLVEETPVEDIRPELVEVVVRPKADRSQLVERHINLSRKDLSMIQLPSSGGKGVIIDETATTGENANKRLPQAAKQETSNSPYLQEISQVIPTPVSLDFPSATGE
jgi:hypothetical protein